MSEGLDEWGQPFQNTHVGTVCSHIEEVFVGTGLLQGIKNLYNSIAGILLTNKIYECI